MSASSTHTDNGHERNDDHALETWEGEGGNLGGGGTPAADRDAAEISYH